MKTEFDKFKDLANDDSLSPYEKIDFPDSYRKGREEDIFLDIKGKISNIDKRKKIVLDIGPGCSDLPRIIIDHCRDHSHELFLIDSEEMLAMLPDAEKIHKHACLYPNCPEIIELLRGRVDAIICYSVFQYIIKDASFVKFIDTSLSLLAPKGQLLIGDIPNISKRKRFFSSENGIAFHKSFMKTESAPVIQFNKIDHESIDDSIVLGVIHRARNQGFDAYVIPQSEMLPMSNRREDILIIRP